MAEVAHLVRPRCTRVLQSDMRAGTQPHVHSCNERSACFGIAASHATGHKHFYAHKKYYRQGRGDGRHERRVEKPIRFSNRLVEFLSAIERYRISVETSAKSLF